MLGNRNDNGANDSFNNNVENSGYDQNATNISVGNDQSDINNDLDDEIPF